MKKVKKQRNSCIVCQGGKGAHLCRACKKSLHELHKRSHNSLVFDEDVARWAARRSLALFRRTRVPMALAKMCLDIESAVKELLPALARAPHSAEHLVQAMGLLESLCPYSEDIQKELEEFNKVCLSPPQAGSPKQPLMSPAEVVGLMEECMPAMRAELAKEGLDSAEAVERVVEEGLREGTKDYVGSTVPRAPGSQIAAALRKNGAFVTDWQLANVSPTATLLTIPEDAPAYDEIVVVDLSSGDYVTVSPCGNKRFQWVPEIRRIIAGHPTEPESK